MPDAKDFPAVQVTALPVVAVGGEVVLGGSPGPVLTPGAARETALRLLAAAELAERNAPSRD